MRTTARLLGRILTNKLDLTSLPRFEKSFYKEAESVKNRTPAEIEAFRAEKQMRVAGRDVPKPIMTFDEAGFPSKFAPLIIKTEHD